MIIKPKIRGFICTTTHPVGCEKNVNEQITYVKSKGELKNGPKRVLVIGASTGYGLASRINAAFGFGAATIGVFFERPGTKSKPGTAGWYNSAAFNKAANKEGLYSNSVNGDAFSNECRKIVINLIKKDLGQIDLVVYSLASPVRKMPDSDELARSALKPIGQPYISIAVDTNRDKLFEATVAPATQKEIEDTIKVMGGQDWELWINALLDAGVLAEHAQTVAYSYIGTELTWPIYWHGTLGKAKEDLERAAQQIDKKLTMINGHAYVAVLKSVVTQASSAIPVMPLYIAIVFKIMKKLGLHEGCVEQIQRLFSTKLAISETPETDENNRLRLDDWELRSDVQNTCRDVWSKVTDDNLYEMSDYQGYKDEFLRLFGFGIDGVDYNVDVDPVVEFDVTDLTK